MLNMTNILLWILQGTSGAIAGYITNKYAVNMLFKEYTPFRIGEKVILPYKFGGVIKNRKEQFVEELSELVERDIINGKTIRSQLTTDIFKEKVQKTAYDFINEYIGKSFGEMKFSEIAGFNISAESIETFTQDTLKDCISELAEAVCTNTKLSSFITEEEINSVTEKFYDILIEEADESDVINKFTGTVCDSISSIEVKELLTKDACDCLINNVESIADELVNKLLDDDAKVTEFINKSFELCESQNAIDKFETQFKERKVSEIINNEEINNLSKDLFEKIQLYFNENGTETVKKFLNSFIEIGKDTEYTIYDLLGEEFGGKLTAFINEKLPIIMPYVSEWIINNKDELDTVIEDSIDEAIGNMDPNIKKLIISKVREFFLDNISAKNQVVDKIVSYVENYKMDDEAFEELSSKIVFFLKKTKIRDIIRILEEKNVINDDMINKLCELFLNEYKKHGEDLISEVLKSLTSRNIGSFVTCDFNDVFNKYIKPRLISSVLDNSNKIKVRFVKGFKNFLNDKLQDILGSPVGKILPSIDGSRTFKSILKKNENTVKEKMNSAFSSYVDNFNLYDKFISNKDGILNEITDIVVDYEKVQFNKLRDRKVSDAISSIDNKEYVSEVIGNELIKYINENSSNFLNGKVKKVVYDNLIQYDEDEICDLAQKFMGNELKPLSVFGGMLGLVVGLVFGLFFKNVNIYGFYKSFGQGISSFILMGLIGVLTNVIAITMLFKPYKKSRILSKIPFINKFALGYIPAHKENLSKSIGKVIDDDILNSSKIQDVLMKNKGNTTDYVISYFENSNYKAVMNFIKNKKDSVIEFIYEKLIKSLSKDGTVSSLNNRVSDIKVNSFVSKNTLLSIGDKIINKKNEIINLSAKYLYEKMQSNNECKEFRAEKILKHFDSESIDNINGIVYDKLASCLNYEFIEKILFNYNDEYVNLIDNPVDKVLSNKSKAAIEDYLHKNAEKFIFKDLKIVVISSVKQKLAKEIDGENSIGSLFDGKVKVLINDNLNKLTDLLIDKVDSVLSKHEALIAGKVKEEVNKNLNFFEKIAYAMAGGDAIVESCVSAAVNKKVPAFINMKVYEINNIIQKSLDNAVYPMSIDELKLKADELNVAAVVNNLFENTQNSSILSSDINNACSSIMNTVYEMKLSSILEYINLNTIDKISMKFNDDIKLILNSALQGFKDNKSKAEEYIKSILTEDVIMQLKEMPMNKFIDGIKENDVYYALNCAGSRIFEDESVISEFNNILSDVYEDKLEGICIKDLCSSDKTYSSIEKIIINSLSNEEILSRIKKAVTYAADEAISQNFGFISDESKKAITEKILSGIIDCTITDSRELIEAVNLKDVTSEQIKLMDSKEIHELFLSFAGTFFKKLYAYGAFGAFFGINLYLPILWAIKENASSVMKNYNNRYKINDNNGVV